MEWFINIMLLIIVYAVLDIRAKIVNYFKYKSTLDLDYPYYSAKDVWVAQIEMDVARKGYDEQREIRKAYWDKNEEELRKVKKDTDHSKEYKDLMHSYYYSADNWSERLIIFTICLR
jgi:hypothetical protein